MRIFGQIAAISAGLVLGAGCDVDDGTNLSPQGEVAPHMAFIPRSAAEGECRAGEDCGEAESDGQRCAAGVASATCPRHDDSAAAYQYGEWSPWSTCSSDGIRARERPCLRGSDRAAASCELCGGSCQETKPCDSAAVDAVQQLVQQAHCRALSRPADSNEVDFFADQIRQGKLTVYHVMRTLVCSSEFRETKVEEQSSITVVQALYDALLARAPDADGESFYAAVLDRGVDYTQVALSILRSAEYATNFGVNLVPGNGRAGCDTPSDAVDCSVCAPSGCDEACQAIGRLGGQCAYPGSTDPTRCCVCDAPSV
jgi:hypothetical protein